MLPTFQPRKPPHRRKRPQVAASAPAPPPVTIVSVEAIAAEYLLWTFSVDVVHWPPDNIPELEGSDNVGSGFVAPFECELVGDNQISAHYAGVDFLADGFSWRVLTIPVGVSFVGGGMLAVPEAG